MAKIISKPNFFKKKVDDTPKAEPQAEAPKAQPAPQPAPKAAPQPAPKAEAPKAAPQPAPKAETVPTINVGPIRLEPRVIQAVQQASQTLRELEQPKLARLVEQAAESATKERFTVAVVGEFSRGKSTFLNRLLSCEALPVGNLPTTAMLTYIRWHKKPALLHFDKTGKQLASLPLTEESWDNLVADNLSGNDPTGNVLVGLNDPFLKATGLELIDTPGAGDLEKERAKLIGDALIGADGAIITISALQAMSMSEKLFIEQRLISRKVPFLMLIVTKLDQVPLKERSKVVTFVENKLKTWNLEIPVLIPNDVQMPDDKYAGRVGMDQVKKKIVSWIQDPRRVELTQNWLLSRVQNLLDTARSVLLEQKALLEGNEAERAEKLQKKLEVLEKARKAWEDLRDQMEDRGTKCYEWLREKADEYVMNITDRLEYEAKMAGNPEKWWNESYPYRLKIELTNMANAVDNAISKKVAEDAAWLNQQLEKQFKTHVLVNRDTVTKKEFSGQVGEKEVQFEDLDKQRNIARIGTTVLTVAGALLFSSLGAFPLIATMGIGTGSSIITEKVFKGKLEAQREAIQEAVRANVPELVNKSMAESEKRISVVYRDILKEAENQEQVWFQAQNEVLEKSKSANADADAAENERKLSLLDSLSAALATLV